MSTTEIRWRTVAKLSKKGTVNIYGNVDEEMLYEGEFTMSVDTSSWRHIYDSSLSVHIAKNLFGMINVSVMIHMIKHMSVVVSSHTLIL